MEVSDSYICPTAGVSAEDALYGPSHRRTEGLSVRANSQQQADSAVALAEQAGCTFSVLPGADGRFDIMVSGSLDQLRLFYEEGRHVPGLW